MISAGIRVYARSQNMIILKHLLERVQPSMKVMIFMKMVGDIVMP